MLKNRMDNIDLRILNSLQNQGRQSNIALAEAIGLSPSPCLRRVKHLERDGLIRGYRAILDRDAVGLALTIFVEIRVDKHSKANSQTLIEHLAAMPEVISCHMVSGVADFLAEIVVPDLKSYERLLSERLLVLPMIADIRSNFSLRRIKSDATLPLPG